MPAFHKIAISTKPKYFSTFPLFFLECTAPFCAMAELKQKAHTKNLMSKYKYKKRGGGGIKSPNRRKLYIRHLRIEELWPIFSTFRCCSHQCLYGEAGVAVLIDTF